MMNKKMILCSLLAVVFSGCGGQGGSGGPILLSGYSDAFNGSSLDSSKWEERLDGYKDANPPAAATYSISYNLAGGELILAPEPSATADWWNGWFGPGLFLRPLDWDTGDYQVDVLVGFTPGATGAAHFAGLIVQDIADPFHYIKFVSFGTAPALFDMNICHGSNGWPASGYSHYLNPTTDLNIAAGSPPPGYDSLTQDRDTVTDFPNFALNIFAMWVQHKRTGDEVILRVTKEGSRVTLHFSHDNGVTFHKGMSGIFNPGQVRIGVVANEMGKPFGGDGMAHFKYVRVFRLD